MRTAAGSVSVGAAAPTRRTTRRTAGRMRSVERHMEAGYPEGAGGDHRGRAGGYPEGKRGGSESEDDAIANGEPGCVSAGRTCPGQRAIAGISAPGAHATGLAVDLGID